MYTLGMVISVCAFLLTGALILRGRRTGLYKRFPLFYLYLIYVFVGTFSMYIIYGAFRQLYPTAYWLYYLVTILVEFTVLIEISDQIFRSFPAIRYLGLCTSGPDLHRLWAPIHLASDLLVSQRP
jgi:hypothetical protein